MARSFIGFAVFYTILIHAGLASAFWRLACSISQESRIDPIVYPGVTSPHLHKFAGGINVQASSNGDTLQNSNCSTCEVQEDRSAYWTPSLFYQNPNGTFESVPNDGMTVYYIGRGGNTSNTQPFPAGFKMVSGNATLRHYDNTSLTYQDTRPIADRVSFRCIDEANDVPETHYINRTDCVNGLRAQINFQSCWDGQNLYLEDDAHVAYLSGIDNGDCPPTHPVPIPGLFYEVLYWVNQIDQQPGGQFVLSNGDPTGYSFHADFMNGWDQDVLDDAVQNCLYTDASGQVSACAALTPSDDVNFPRDCPQAPMAIDELITGTLTSLPGCNPVTTDEATAADPPCGTSSTAISVSISSTSVTSPATSSVAPTTPSATSVSTTSTLSVITTTTPGLQAAQSFIGQSIMTLTTSRIVSTTSQNGVQATQVASTAPNPGTRWNHTWNFAGATASGSSESRPQFTVMPRRTFRRRRNQGILRTTEEDLWMT